MPIYVFDIQLCAYVFFVRVYVWLCGCACVRVSVPVLVHVNSYCHIITSVAGNMSRRSATMTSDPSHTLLRIFTKQRYGGIMKTLRKLRS